jgi:predicted aldo/keto reductase-like oxidoreductase
LDRTTYLSPSLPAVLRLGVATRGGSQIQPDDVRYAIDRGVNYLNWCGHADGLSRAIASLGPKRSDVVVALQFEASSAASARREFARYLDQLETSYLDIATLYYVESESEWDEIVAPKGPWQALAREKERGRLRMIGLTTHQRNLAARWAGTGKLDMLMIRYNAAHRGAEREIFPTVKIPVVTFTGLRWKALLRPSPDASPTAADCYRFCLAHPGVAVALAAPSNRAELESNLTLLDDWQAPTSSELERMRRHGDWVRSHAGAFP